MTIDWKGSGNPSQSSKVFLVGAGPGDPELLTLKAARLLCEADAVVYDRLVSDAVLALAPEAAERIFVGKESGFHALPQDQINALLVRLASRCKRVVRLKGGDPFVFGRGSEEAVYLGEHGVACEVVPGITAAMGCGAAAGIPLTHRGLASGVRFVTGHCRENGALDLDWHRLADPDTTIVIYMGLANLPLIAARLMDAGLSPQTPAAAIADGTLPGENVVASTLASLPAAVAAHGLRPPATLVIGRVAAFAQADIVDDGLVACQA
jgi:uroporphyrin-III C-methyltransferase